MDQVGKSSNPAGRARLRCHSASLLAFEPAALGAYVILIANTSTKAGSACIAISCLFPPEVMPWLDGRLQIDSHIMT
jgi:hypothetical protein